MHITLDDLDLKTLTNIRIQHKIYMSDTANVFLTESDYIAYQIRQFNYGLESVINLDEFEEVKEEIPAITKPLLPVVQEEINNVNKKLLVTFCNDQAEFYTLVDDSTKVDPDKNIISIHSDLGKVLHKAKLDEEYIFGERYIMVVKKYNTEIK